MVINKICKNNGLSPIHLQQVFSHSSDLAANNRRLAFCPACGTAFTGERLDKFERQRCPHCHRVQYLNPAPGVAVLIRDHQQRILIGRRSETTTYGGKWCLPGGYIEYEETFIEAAHREVLEETGLTIRLQGIINVVSNHLDDCHHTLVIVLVAERLAGEAVPGDDITELRWISDIEHRSIPYAFEADQRIIDCALTGHLPVLPVDSRCADGPDLSLSLHP